MLSAERAISAPAQSLRPRSGHIVSLDGFRGLAVLLVLFFHVGQVNSQGRGGVIALLGHLQQSGWIGVEMFFTLSGFLITGILLHSVDQPHYFRTFYARRTLRIFPLYYGVLLLLGVSAIAFHLSWHGCLPYLLFYVQNFRTGTGQLQLEIGNPTLHIPLRHFWTLAVEEQFYLVWPLLVFSVRGRRSFLWIAGFFILLCPMLRWLGSAMGIAPAALRYWTLFHVDSLAWGGLAATLQTTVSQRKAMHVARVLVLGGAACTLAVLYLEHGSFVEMAAPTVRIFFSSFAALCSGLLLVLTGRRGLLVRFFAMPWLCWFGRYSYGIYVFHMLALEAFEWVRFYVIAHTGSRALGALSLMASAYGFSAGLAYASFHLFEQRFLKLKDKIAPSLTSGVHVQAAASQETLWNAGKAIVHATQK